MSASLNGEGAALPALRETSTAMVAAQAKAAVEARYTMAIHRPRDEDRARQKILADCARQSFAEAAEYAKPIGKDKVRGASIRLVESALRAWGNVQTQSHTLYDDEDKLIVSVEVTDLESNNTYSDEITVPKTVERRFVKNGTEVVGERLNSYGDKVYIVKATDDEMLTKLAALKSKSIRTMGLRVLPGDLIDEARDRCRATLANADKADPAAARKKVVDSFNEVGVNAAELKAYVGQSLDSLSPSQMKDLREVFAGIRSGETTWREVVEAGRESDAVEKVRTASSPAAAAASFTEPKGKRGKAAHDAETGEVTGEMTEDEMADIRAQEFALAGGDA